VKGRDVLWEQRKLRTKKLPERLWACWPERKEKLMNKSTCIEHFGIIDILST
jgi:hypothetical protein